ncbi:MAG: ParB N-terminal domain-containing protein, partial [Actinomycetes bacterium]
MAKRQSLGRGLGALIPDVSRETASSSPKAGTGGKPGKKAAAPKKTVPVSKSAAKPAAKAPAKSAVAPAVQGNSQAPTAIAGLTFAELAIRSIVPNAQQPRQVFEDEALAELVHSIQEVGLLQPIVVRPSNGG